MKRLQLNKAMKLVEKENLDRMIEYISVVVLTLFAIIIVEGIGVLLLKAIGKFPLNFFYNFLLGFGAITLLAFVVAAYEELRDYKGAKKDVRK